MNHPKHTYPEISGSALIGYGLSQAFQLKILNSYFILNIKVKSHSVFL